MLSVAYALQYKNARRFFGKMQDLAKPRKYQLNDVHQAHNKETGEVHMIQLTKRVGIFDFLKKKIRILKSIIDFFE